MTPTPYEQLSDVSLCALCVWREARGEPMDGKRGVAHVILNRVQHGGWFGQTVHAVVLKPWQFSSFNRNDPNAEKWPGDEDASWTDALSAASAAIVGGEVDLTNGATHYYDTSIGFPKAWGNEAEYENTLNVGRLRFWKLKPLTNAFQVEQATTGEN